MKRKTLRELAERAREKRGGWAWAEFKRACTPEKVIELLDAVQPGGLQDEALHRSFRTAHARRLSAHVKGD